MILQEANTTRNDWQMCRVIEKYCDEKELMRSVRLKIRSVDQAGRNNIMDRPMSKMCYFLKVKKLMKTCLNPCQGSHELNAM